LYDEIDGIFLTFRVIIWH